MYRRGPLTPTTILAIAAVSVLAAGCGGGSSTHARATPTPSGALAYAHCMRSHGIANFPDPTGENNAPKPAVVSALQAVGAAKAQAASTACMRVNDGTPGTGQGAQHSQAHPGAMLAFAHCMRNHGFRNFPDPTGSGQLTPEMVVQAGINLQQPAFLKTADNCVSVTHGALTKADVARAVNQSSNASQ